jgi:HD-GYP domain-containing protein (c-di-GMP phosphodiesterase class II)
MAASDYELPEIRELRRGVERLRSLAIGRDPRTGAHERRVARLSAAIATRLGLTPIRVAVLELAAGIHDIGKLQVPAAILHKQGRLTDEEREAVRAHARYGFDALKLLRSPFPIADFVHEHHERVDGKGYPRGLMGRDLHLESRILTAADAYDSMASKHSYQPGRNAEAVTAELQRVRGQQLDEAVVDALLEMLANGEAERCLAEAGGG